MCCKRHIFMDCTTNMYRIIQIKLTSVSCNMQMLFINPIKYLLVLVMEYFYMHCLLFYKAFKYFLHHLWSRREPFGYII